MKLFNKKYQDQMISVDVSIFSIIDNKLSVLLLKRSEEPYKNLWSLIGGGVYNDETCEMAVKRELKEKMNIERIEPLLANVFSDPKRDPRFRNISISYFCLVNFNELNFNPSADKAEEAKWFSINEVKKLAFDHNKILETSLNLLRNRIFEIDFIKNYIPSPFTLGQLQSIFESILGVELDKRNFRRKLNSLDCLCDTGLKNESDLRKKSSLFTFK